MPTNEERRQVATRLLHCASLGTLNPIPGYLKKAVHGNYPHWILYSDSSTLERLASLIEPEPERTCRIVGSGKENDPEAGWVCDQCGYKQPYGLEDLQSFNYCPDCGAKVIQ